MITRSEIRGLARARLKDAEALCRARRYNASAYVCGYAVELGLKARICKTLSWAAYPLKSREFERLLSFKTHDLEILLHLSGVKSKIRRTHLAQWSAFARWTPEIRYNPVRTATRAEAEQMVESARALLRVL